MTAPAPPASQPLAPKFDSQELVRSMTQRPPRGIRLTRPLPLRRVASKSAIPKLAGVGGAKTPCFVDAGMGGGA